MRAVRAGHLWETYSAVSTVCCCNSIVDVPCLHQIIIRACINEQKASR